MKHVMRKKLMIMGVSGLLITACDDNNSHDSDSTPEPMPVVMRYDVTISNMSAAQPFSPIAVLLHDDQSLWQVGEPASDALELLAEGGDNTDVIATEGVYTTDSGSGPVSPGDHSTFVLTVTDQASPYLSVLTMLVNTNDGFTGVTNMSLATLGVNDSITMTLPVYDAGTESNSEAAGTIPGPADGGEGFNALRDDIADSVSYHSGVVSSQDGLSQSALLASHRFDQPIAKLIVTRLE